VDPWSPTLVLGSSRGAGRPAAQPRLILARSFAAQLATAVSLVDAEDFVGAIALFWERPEDR
jgi:hypothetical protein